MFASDRNLPRHASVQQRSKALKMIVPMPEEQIGERTIRHRLAT